MPVAEMEKENSGLTAEENDILKMSEKIQENILQDKKFADTLDKFLKSSEKSTDFLHVGNTSNALAISGANQDLEVVISPKTIVKCMSEAEEHYHGHGLSQAIMEQLPRELRNPVMVFKGSEENSLVAITELKDKELREIMVAVSLSEKSKRHEVNRISSAYGRNNMTNYLKAQIEQGNLLAANKEKANEMLQSAGLQLPLEETFISFDNSIAYTTANVKYPDKNIAENTLECFGKEKAVEMHLDKRVQSPQSTAIHCFDNSISYTDQNVKPLQVGDKIQYDGEEYTITSLESDVPNSIQITQQGADGLDYTYHIDKDKLLSHSSFVYLKDDKNAEFEYLKNTEMAMEDDYNSIDGIINNGKRDEHPETNDNEQRQQTVYPQKKGNMYINADYYKALSANERKVHTLSSEAADNLMKKLSEQNIPFSAVRNGDKTRVTVSKANESIVSEIISAKESKYINPDFYKSLDKSERYTQRMDEKSAKKIVGELARNGIEHSAVINGNKSAITIKQSDYSKAKNFTISRDFLKKRSVEKHNIPSNEQDRTKNKNRGGRE